MAILSLVHGMTAILIKEADKINNGQEFVITTTLMPWREWVETYATNKETTSVVVKNLL